MVVYNISKEKVICQYLQTADTFFTRLKGLLGRSSLRDDEGLLLVPCQSVHTFGMKFTIDVIFLAGDGEVIALIENLAPNRVSRHYPKAKKVLELQAGKIKEAGVEIGDQISTK